MSRELDARLVNWASEYAGSRYEHTGWPARTWLANMIEYGGRIGSGRPQVVIGTPADEVEQAVAELERTREGFRPGRVLRCEYWMPSAAIEHRILALRAIGLPMSRAGYYTYLGRARYYVAGVLRLPVSEPVEA